jgi:quinol monooxygenase YgiN
VLVGDRAVTVGLLVRLEAKSGKENEVAQLLRDGLSFVLDEPATPAWFAIRITPAIFGIFDAFPDEDGREAHLAGRLAAALVGRASELLAQPPSIERVDVLAAKLSF